MQSNDWAPAHSEALRVFVAQGLSFAEIARAINAKFGTNYTRSAAIGRSKRMGLSGSDRPDRRPERAFKARAQGRKGSKRRVEAESAAPELQPPLRAEPIKLRCVGISPRLIALVELAAGDCRYPYGGDKDDEPITFCGHPRQEGSSYCMPHFHLTRGQGTASERAAGPILLRLVEAA